MSCSSRPDVQLIVECVESDPRISPDHRQQHARCAGRPAPALLPRLHSAQRHADKARETFLCCRRSGADRKTGSRARRCHRARSR